jgi:hypothetical protein
MEIVFLLEELSAKYFLDEFLPTLLPRLPKGTTFTTIPHSGKSDLQRSLPRKLRAWRNPDARFVILHDKDMNDCLILKNKLRKICLKARPDLNPLVRIACHELESWYLGDPEAIQKAFPSFDTSKVIGKAKFRDVDSLSNQKVGGSRRIGSRMKVTRNTSKSFQVFVSGIEKLLL